MKLIPATCPKCSAQLHLNEGTKACFCTYCGTQILLDDESKTVIYRKIDEARIKEADVKQVLALKEMEIEEKKRHDRKKSYKVLFIVSGLIFVLALAAGMFNSDTGYLLGLVAFLILGWGVMIISPGDKDKKENSERRMLPRKN